MGQKPSVPNDSADPPQPAGTGQGYFEVLSGCSAPCYDASSSWEGGNSLTKVVQQCCIASEQEGVLELVEQQRVIEDNFHYGDGDATSSSSAGAQRRALVVDPHQNKRFEDCYTLLQQIGEGSFGNVYGAQASISAKVGEVPARSVAVKIFSMTAEKTELEGQKRFSSFLAECVMLSRLEHPHIVRMLECFQSEKKLHLVLELCRGGELYACLVRRIKEAGSGGLPEISVKVFLRQMLWAVAYLHANRIVHRDIKPENFLLFDVAGTAEAEVLKLCDFGTAMVLTDQKPRSMVNIGTLSYTAPEVYAHLGADLPADIWSLGVVLYVMLTGTNPFRGSKDATKQDTVRKIKSGSFATQRPSWSKVSDQGQDVVRKFLVLDEKSRLTSSQALRHDWLADIRRIKLEPDVEDQALTVWRLMQQLKELQEPQRLALCTCAMASTEADIPSGSSWRALFLELDEDNDGCLRIPELCMGLRKVAGVSPTEASDDELVAAANALDTDSSGAIDWAEWLALALLQLDFSQAEVITQTAFRLLDRLPGQRLGNNKVRSSINDYVCELKGMSEEYVMSLDDFRMLLNSCQGRRV